MRNFKEKPTVFLTEQERSQIVQYDLSFDRANYQELLDLKATLSEEEYIKKKQGLDALTRFNLETALGERFNTGLSRRRDDIVDGRLRDHSTGEILLEIFKKGQEWMAKNGSTPYEQQRELAEVIGFSKIQEIMVNEQTPLGTMMLSISQPGGRYKHNFYDVFTLKIDEKGERYVQADRWSSALDIQESVKKAKSINPFHKFSFYPTDVELLTNPVLIDPWMTIHNTSEKIHAFFHRDHTFMPVEQFEEIKKEAGFMIDAYIQQMNKDPHNIRNQGVTFNAILNYADFQAGFGRSTEKSGEVFNTSFGKVDDYSERAAYYMSRLANTISYWGTQEVRSVDTGCGISGGAIVTFGHGIHIGSNGMFGRTGVSQSPFSVFDAGRQISKQEKEEAYSFDKKGTCIDCKGENLWLGPCKLCKSCDFNAQMKQLVGSS